MFMRIYGLIVCFIYFTSCSLGDNFYQNKSFPTRPPHGFDRGNLFPQRLEPGVTLFGNMCAMLRTRKDWNPVNIDFKKTYPYFQIDLLSFINFSVSGEFTWQERIMFADALELVIFVINHPLFEEKMKLKTFYNNDRTEQVSSVTIIKNLKKSIMTFSISKADLDENVLAQATVSGFQHTIWFRADVHYQQYNVISLAVILAHELTHNLGYLHTSNVPYGIQDPIMEVIKGASLQDVNLFKKNTPYYEEIFLKRIRKEASSKSSSLRVSTRIQQDTEEDFGDTLHRI